jgi:3-oxoacyl-[acyl-carrier-protein] synthase-3
MNVLSFSITKAPESIRMLSDHFNLDLNQVDYFLFHQANLFINERIRKKLNIPIEKVPYSLRDFGNTGPGSIPLTLVSQIGSELKTDENKSIIACGFGVGLTWGSVQFFTKNVVCSEILII